MNRKLQEFMLQMAMNRRDHYLGQWAMEQKNPSENVKINLSIIFQILSITLSYFVERMQLCQTLPFYFQLIPQ